MKALAVALLLVTGCGASVSESALRSEVGRAHVCAARDIEVESITPRNTDAWVNACGWHRHYVATSSGWHEVRPDAARFGASTADSVQSRITARLIAEASAEHSCADVAVIAHEGSDPTHVWLLVCGHQRLYVREDSTWNESAATSEAATE